METTKRSIPELSIDSKLLYERLKKLAPGEVCSYAELTELIKRDVQEDARGNLTTARRMLLNEDMINTECVQGEGIKRLRDNEIASLGTKLIDHIHRSSRRGIRKLSCVRDFNSLKNEEKVQHNTALSFMGLFAHITTPKEVRRIESEVDRLAMQPLAIGRTLEAFKGNKE